MGLFSINCKQINDCSKAKNGKFFYYSKFDRHKVFIERKDSLQTETDAQNNRVLKSKVIWEGDCKFLMFVNAFSETKLTQSDSLLSIKAIPIEIIKVTNDYYICTVKFSTAKKSYELTDTMYFQK
jgi:hypothetical protein